MQSIAFNLLAITFPSIHASSYSDFAPEIKKNVDATGFHEPQSIMGRRYSSVLLWQSSIVRTSSLIKIYDICAFWLPRRCNFQIDMMFLYTPRGRDILGVSDSQMQSELADYVNGMNTAMDNSDVDLQFSLVRIEPVNPTRGAIVNKDCWE